jgi:hypothetical protein
MDRRGYLALVGAAGAGLAGCAGAPRADVGPGAAQSDDGAGNDGAAGGPQPPDGAYWNASLPVPESDLRRGAARDGIPAIVDPAFGDDWSDVDVGATLGDGTRVVGVERGREARAYPLVVLRFHEVVNDEFAGPLLVTYCPLCASAVVARRLVDGQPTRFGVSGLLWQSDLVLYDDATGSLWSQVLARAIRGERTGDNLDLLPATVTTWGSWRDAHPDSSVLLPPPASGTIVEASPRPYDLDFYAGYRNSQRIGAGYNTFSDDRLLPKTRVVGVTHGGVARAYPARRVEDAGVVNDTVGGLPVVVAATADGTLQAYDRRVQGRTLEFGRDGDVLVAGGSRFDPLTGRAVSGPLGGTRLRRATDRSPMYWFAWAEFHPGTDVYGGPGPTLGSSGGRR